MRCEGWRRYGGAFTLGPVRWEQCKDEATIKLTTTEDGKEIVRPACQVCWKEACSSKAIHILKAEPI